MLLTHFYQLAKQSVSAWIDDYAPSMGAAISYYTVFSIAPLLIIVIAVAGFVWGREAVQGQLVGQLTDMIGKEGATGIQALIESANQPTQGLVATVISTLVLIVGATTVFAELQSALDRIWQVPQAPKAGGIWATLRTRLLSLGFILGLGFLMLVSLVSSAGIAALGGWAKGLLPGWAVLLYVINLVVSVGFTTVLFAMIFKLMPQAQVSWRDVWVGAGVTAVLFEIGKTLISLYIGKSSVTSSFAAAGSLVVLLIWVYYSAQIFLLGAEFTWAYANAHGSRVGKKNNPSALTAPESSKEDGGKKIPTLVTVASETAKDGAPDSQAFSGHADDSDEATALRPYHGTEHASLKQRAIVYAGSLAALIALRVVLKKKGRSRRSW
ncbi:membrane protein [Polaromonas sp. CG_9.5]|uniref:YihY/virulence factor BrkB family protein n=1 Tax=Polaromonas sp. CG_9.5 TaxID=3071705 RepID=UPI002E043364|nr:membrane protein [Polaromonas sp. CG_9.5]